MAFLSLPIDTRICTDRGRVPVADPGVERKHIQVPIGQAVAARIIPNECVGAREPPKDMPPNRAFPVVLEMVQPVPSL
jgi:hypothetical protein